MLTGPILIAGAGALGSVMGGMLRAAGHRVALLGRPAHLDAVARRGLLVDGLFGRHEARRSGWPVTADGRESLLLSCAVLFYTDLIPRRRTSFIRPCQPLPLAR